MTDHVHAAALVPTVAPDFAPVTLGPHFQITPAGLTVTGEPSFEQCQALWDGLTTLEKGIQFAIGDAMRYFKKRWGERAAQIVSDATGWSFSTLSNYEWVATHVAADNRMLDRGLSFRHHQVVAKYAPRESVR